MRWNVLSLGVIAGLFITSMALFGVHLGGLGTEATAIASAAVVKAAFVGSIAYASGVLGIALITAKGVERGKFDITLNFLVLSSLITLGAALFIVRHNIGTFLDAAIEGALVGMVSTLVAMMAALMREEIRKGKATE